MHTRIELVESRVLRAACYAQTALAGAALVLAALPPALTLGALLLLLMMPWLTRRWLAPLPRALTLADGCLSLDVGGERLPILLASECHCHPCLIVLRFKVLLSDDSPASDAKTLPRRLVLLPDSAPPDALRRLRIFLRWQAFEGQSGAGLSEQGAVGGR